jgi:hypothetical protein
MSTKPSIQWRERTVERLGFHLYDDVIDEFSAGKQEEPPAHLRLDDDCASLETFEGGIANLTVTLPRELAVHWGCCRPFHPRTKTRTPGVSETMKTT